MATDIPKSDRPGTLVLGTAQLGMEYGAANRTGMPPENEAIAIIRAAVEGGVRTIDTARGYGASEHRIGLALGRSDLPRVTVVTKLDPMPDVAAEAPANQAIAAAMRSLDSSRRALGRDRLDILILHRPSHRTDWGGAVWDTLRQQRDAGAIGKLGVSVQTPEEASAALADRAVEYLQLPLNVLDRRWSGPAFVDARAARTGVTFHARSALLQGLLAGAPDARWPVFAGWSPKEMMSRLHDLARSYGRESIADLCLAWVRAQNWIDGVVLGMETLSQVDTNIAHFRSRPLFDEQWVAVTEAISGFPDKLPDPPRWPKERRPLSSWQNH